MLEFSEVYSDLAGRVVVQIQRRHFVLFCFLIACLLSTTVLYGWIYHIPMLKTLLPGRPDMKANTAICFLLMSFGIVLTQSHLKQSWQKRAGQLFALLAFAFAASVMVEYVFNVTFFLDEFFFVDPTRVGGHSPPGRFSSMTAFNFLLLSIAALMTSSFKKPWEKTAQSLAILCFLISFHSFIGNALGLPEVFGMEVFMPMAVHTGFIFVLLSMAYLASRLSFGLMRLFSANTLSSLMARRMLVAVTLVPLAIRVLSYTAEHHGWLRSDIGVFIRVMGGQIFMSAVVLRTAAALWRAEKERAQLRESEKRNAEQLKLVTDSQSSLIAYVGRDLRFQIVNQAYADWFGREKAAFVGLGLEDVFGRRVAVPFKQYAADVLGGKFVRFRNELAVSDGRILKVQTTFIPHQGESGEVLGFVVVIHDITESLQIQSDLEAAKTLAEEASLAKSQFLANMSHEIRTPLGVILGFSDLALESIEQTEEVKDFLNVIRRNAKELSKLLGEILDLSKVEAKQLEIESIEFALSPLIQEVIELLATSASEKGLELKVELEPSLPEKIFSDPTRVRQILINLLGNAIKFTQSGWVRLRVYVSTEPSAQLCFEVSDTGIGISRDKQDRLFKAFSQADSSMTRKFGGTGLGLLLSKQLAQALGGDLTLVHSEDWAGSTFAARIALKREGRGRALGLKSKNAPATSDQENSHPRPAEGRDGELSGVRVLLVEDVVENQILVEAYLKSSGALLSVAENGQEALDFAAKENFDIVLMDIQMPVMDGYKATSLLRERGFANPIIALTAHAIHQEKERAMAIGFSAYLTKPILKDILLETLASFVAKK